MTSSNLDWSRIRPLNGSSHNGFEELCAQLAEYEIPDGATFERKGTPDAGVECYAILDDGTEWGWQAKYFDNLGNSQWSQLDDSVETALDKHPRLTRYFICIPLNLPDARIPKQRSAKDRWDDHVKKWKGLAKKRGMSVEFIYWGSFQLISRLSQPEQIGRLRFWFDVTGFDESWLRNRLDESLKTAGPRYTPEIHVDLPIAIDFEAFGRTEYFFNNIKSNARGIRKKVSRVCHTVPEIKDKATDISKHLSAVTTSTESILSALARIDPDPVDVLPFSKISTLVDNTIDNINQFEEYLFDCERNFDDNENETRSRYRSSPFRELIYALSSFRSELDNFSRNIANADSLSASSFLILTGDAGTGKTHLLCDVARSRIDAGRPTILLLGQRFISQEDPWRQALQQLDLAAFSADEFVGALESAAQAAGCRALVLIDALNEGAGRDIWPNHLAAFISHLERSKWIATCLSIRSSYLELVIPEEFRSSVVQVNHTGFTDNEYDATKAYFEYYHLELPSTPLLSPEFGNPFFLKTLCRGLNLSGKRRLPRGLNGITSIFDLFLRAINDRLSKGINFNRKKQLVHQALESFVIETMKQDVRWLSIANAEKVVNALLPMRDYEHSLYGGLVAEGLLVEEAIRHGEHAVEEVVFISYERFADHIFVKTLLEKNLDLNTPHKSFAIGSPLDFLNDKKQTISPGILEALCIQIPELTGNEFITLAPNTENLWGIGNAFRQSLIWRSTKAFSDETPKILNRLTRSEYDWCETIEMLLTVATLHEHPFNADFLNKRLRKDAMPNRDTWWSALLHKAWENDGAVHRLVDWAFAITPDYNLDDKTLSLSSIALTWMLTTSNRFLRDRATMALVNLLTGRVSCMTKLVEQFVDVDDPYVLERVYAVAYGVAMRSQDSERIGILASKVYSHVFEKDLPPAHIILRDYARGVIERALYLGTNINVETDRIRPPYGSPWPHIPTEDEIKPFMPDWSRGSHDSGELEWARNRIGSSIMSDDFGRYVIGTNTSPMSNTWLSLRISDPKWLPPKRPSDLITELLARLSDKERIAWDAFEAAHNALKAAEFSIMIANSVPSVPDIESETDVNIDSEVLRQGLTESSTHEVERLNQERDTALGNLEAVISTDNKKKLKEIFVAFETEAENPSPSGLDLSVIQRYILWRVFDLGWTTERFGEFDRFSIGHYDRKASKVERIGKKYQWIAYHEIMALIADNYQYRESFGNNYAQSYEGPWQEHYRDIDPSCTLRFKPGGTSWDGHEVSWWGSKTYNNFNTYDNHLDWVKHFDDLPRIEELIFSVNPDDGTQWVNLNGYYVWKQQAPPDIEPTDTERRELWYLCNGYFIEEGKIDAFMNWSKEVDFWGRWMPDPPEVYRIFLGEYGWSPSWRYIQQEFFGDEGWESPGKNCPGKVRVATFNYLREGSGFDCAIDEGYTLQLPCVELIDSLELHWNGEDAQFIDEIGKLVAFDPTARDFGPSALLVREDALLEFLSKNKLALFWAILGEKRILGAGFDPGYHPELRLSGAGVLSQRGHSSHLKCMFNDSRGSESSGKKVIRIFEG